MLCHEFIFVISLHNLSSPSLVNVGITRQLGRRNEGHSASIFQLKRIEAEFKLEQIGFAFFIGPFFVLHNALSIIVN